MLECWESLLSSGVGLIDIVDNPAYHHKLEDPQLAENNPHFKNGFFCVTFACHISYEFAKDILINQQSEEVMVHFIRRYWEHLRNPSRPNPAMQLGPKGEVPEKLCIFGVPIYHSDFYFSPTQLADSKDFVDRMRSTIAVTHKGFSYDIWIFIHPGRAFLPISILFGYGVVRRYTSGLKAKGPKNFVLCSTKNPQTNSELNLPESCDATKRWFGENQFLFKEDLDLKAKFNKFEQIICTLMVQGWDKESIASAVGRTPGHVANTQTAIGAKLARSNYLLIPRGNAITSEMIIQALRGKAAHEIRQFMVPVYRWPENLLSRPE